jgi:serine/threonine-protein kinase
MPQKMIGQILDERYRILKKLGQGGMGEVYLAEHLHLVRREALKVLHPSLAKQPEFVSRFRREARAINRLQHPNIVTVHNFGQLPDGRFYLAMEYAEGESLANLIDERGPLDIHRALDVLEQLADAIDHAHTRGVVHRDLKPDNLLLVDRPGRPDHLKVLDFGIAKIVAADYLESLRATPQGEVFGTVDYMAPEQLTGSATDPRSDLYAVGCIAYELFTGKPPFVGRSVEVVNQHLRAKPEPPSAQRAEVTPAMDALVLRCIEKQPKRRFQSGGELRDAIRQLAT